MDNGTRRDRQGEYLHTTPMAYTVQITAEFDLYETVGSALFGNESDSWTSGNAGLELIDLAAVK